MTDRDTIGRLGEIKDAIADLLVEARTLLRNTSEYHRADAYWLAHIRCALDNDHAYLGGSMVTMQDTIEALAEAEDGGDDD